VLEGLLDYERAGRKSAAVTQARKRAENYLLERRMFARFEPARSSTNAGSASRSRRSGTTTSCIGKQLEAVAV
jgi:hypothetical protein